MYDEEERRQELLRRRAIRRRHKMREKRRRVRRRRFMLSVLVAAIVLFCLIRLGLLAYSAIHNRIDKTEQQAEQTEQTQSEKQTEQTESSYSMAIITTAAGLNVRTGPGTTYPRVTTQTRRKTIGLRLQREPISTIGCVRIIFRVCARRTAARP